MGKGEASATGERVAGTTREAREVEVRSLGRALKAVLAV
jgi:hypothetical protein